MPRVKRYFGLLLVAVLWGCAPAHPACPPTQAQDVVYVVGRGWHAELGIPVAALKGDAAFYRHVFPGARVIMFGYGKKTFFTAPPQTISEYILGPVPGPAAIHAVGLRVEPPEAYSPEITVTLTLPPGGGRALSAFIWDDLAKDASGRPIPVSRSTDPDGIFYAANSEYSLAHTCNSWTAEGLQAAGLPVSAAGVVFSGQAMARAKHAAEGQCRPLLGH